MNYFRYLPKIIAYLGLRLNALTASHRRFPDFLIIGAQRSGTSSVFHYLAQHPQLKLPSLKEVHYYDLNYHKGSNWYKKYFPRKQNPELSGEASPYYLLHPLVPQRVFADNPKAKIIVLLRNPGERAYSHYKLMKKMGFEPLSSFAEAVRAEPSRFRKGLKKIYNDPAAVSFEHQHFTYLSRGKYALQLKRWLACFPRQQFLILQAEEFFARPRESLKKIYRFLGVEEVYPGDLKPKNQGEAKGIPREEKQRLDAYFLPYNKRLESLLNTKFSW